MSQEQQKERQPTGSKNMNYKFDELPKGLAQSVTRRQALKKFRVGLAGMALACFGLASRGNAGTELPSGANDLVFFNVIHTYTPADICAAYGVDALHAEGWTGKGQTIVVVDSYGSPTALQDLQFFSSTYGLPAPDLTIIYPNGQPTLNSSDKLSSAGETSLDLQWAHAIAPDAKLVLIAANPSETDGVQGFPSMFAGIQYAISNYPGSPISQSFAAAEESFASAAPVQMQQYELIYQQAIAAGCTPLASSGDTGVANPIKQNYNNGTGSSGKEGDVYPGQTVNWPASSPSVTAVGGTWLQFHWRWDPQTNFAAFLAVAGMGPAAITGENPVAMAYLNWEATQERVETVWREDWQMVLQGGFGTASGGGLSAVFPTPSWQAGLPRSLNQGARALPDLSWHAAEDGGVHVYDSTEGGWRTVGGTSAATPQIAGLVALVNQMRASLGKGPIGHLAPKLYQLPASDFNDIVPQTFGSGANAVTVGDNFCYGYNVPGLPTTVGYDLTTGLGSPKAYSLVHDLATMFP
jgi:subtilase family serine protease